MGYYDNKERRWHDDDAEVFRQSIYNDVHPAVPSAGDCGTNKPSADNGPAGCKWWNFLKEAGSIAVKARPCRKVRRSLAAGHITATAVDQQTSSRRDATDGLNEISSNRRIGDRLVGRCR